MSHELYDLFETVYTPYFSNSEGAARIADRIEVHRFDHRPGLEGVRVALFGVLDGRNSGDNEGCAAAPDAIRERLYRLMPHRGWMPTVDLGNLRPGVTSQDTHAAVRMVVNELVTMGIVPVVLGGGQDLTVPMYEALSVLGEPLNVVTWDARLDFGADPGATTAANYMNDIVLAEPNRLFDYVNIGHQGYLTDADTLELLDKMQFDAKRLGLVHDDVEAMEPILRDADLVSIDMQAVRGADHPAHAEAGPNGLDAQQVCRLHVALRCPITTEHDHESESMQVILWHAQVCAAQQVKQFGEVVARCRCDEGEAANQGADHGLRGCCAQAFNQSVSDESRGAWTARRAAGTCNEAANTCGISEPDEGLLWRDLDLRALSASWER